jgi:hypothetical protein
MQPALRRRQQQQQQLRAAQQAGSWQWVVLMATGVCMPMLG